MNNETTAPPLTHVDTAQINAQQPTADALVLFGATGDLAKRKLFPALYHLQDSGSLNVAVIGVAALSGRRWLLPIGVLLAMPVIWWGSLALLTACVALKREEIEDRIEAALAWIEQWQHRRLDRQGAPVSST